MPGVGGPRGVFFKKARWRLQRKPPGRPLARRHPPRCVNRRFKRERRNGGLGSGAGPVEAALRVLWLRKCTGAWGRGSRGRRRPSLTQPGYGSANSFTRELRHRPPNRVRAKLCGLVAGATLLGPQLQPQLRLLPCTCSCSVELFLSLPLLTLARLPGLPA